MLHLTLGMLKSRGLDALWNSSKPGWPTLNAAEIGAAIHAALASGDPAAPAQADADLIAGIAAYRRHPWRRDLLEPPHVWAEGGSRLLDYGLGPADGPVMLFVPSLINRAYVLDLMEGHSMLRWFATQGVRPLLLDWGWPGQTERGFTLTDYIAGRLERAIAAVGAPVVLVGYCMGGNLAVAAAERRPDLVKALALLATPWDFHAPDPARARSAAACLPLLEPALTFNGTRPIDALQTLFTWLDPFGVGDKYRAFGQRDQDSAQAKLFVAMEDWLNDGVPLVAAVARACLSGWYGENDPINGRWQIAGLVVKPSALRLPVWVAAPGRDRIVPPESARPLAAVIPGAVLHEPAAGHVGMVAGAAAERALWQPLLSWTRSLVL